jgi:hypothetical protein
LVLLNHQTFYGKPLIPLSAQGKEGLSPLAMIMKNG